MDLTTCGYCGVTGKFSRCKRCLNIQYCSKDHQVLHWKTHKKVCFDITKSNNSGNGSYQPSINSQKTTASNSTSPSSVDGKSLMRSRRSDTIPEVRNSQRNTSPITYEGSSENEIIKTGTGTENLDDILQFLQSGMTESSQGSHSLELNNFGALSIDDLTPLCKSLIKDMENFGLCVMDDFLGEKKGKSVFEEVKRMHTMRVFEDGQLVSNKAKTDLKTIRGDQITWVDGKETSCKNIGYLINRVDAVIMGANRMENNGKMGDYKINGRTKAMVACYPGKGSHYVKHVDNPNRDGRCITAIYYLNCNWESERDGGLLRIFAERGVADIEPMFDRVLFFWSDRRNPHEVQPANKTRYAITLWYFDAAEREAAVQQYHSRCREPASHKKTHLLADCS